MIRPTNIYLSYAHADHRRADAIIAALKALLPGIGPHGAEVWHGGEIKGGAIWTLEVDAAIRRSDIFVILLSNDYLASPYTAEVELAFILCEQRDRGGLVIPVITRATDLGMLERFQTIDARNRSAQWIATKLADAVMTYSASEAGSLVAHA